MSRSMKAKHRARMAGLPGWILLACLLWPTGPAQVQVQAQPGWPRGGATGELQRAAPALFDFDNDGTLEIVTVSSENKLYVYSHTGELYDESFPVALGFGGGTIVAPAVGDVDGDGNPEIVLAGNDLNGQNGRIEVYRPDGTTLATLDLPGAELASVKATPCLFNCLRYVNTTPHPGEEIILRDGDGQMHFVYWNGSGLSDRFDAQDSIYRTVEDETLMDRGGSQPIGSSAAATLISTDTTRVVVGSSDGAVYRWTIGSSTGSGNNWSIDRLAPIQLTAGGARYYSSPLLVDLDGDGDRDIFIGDSHGTMYGFDGDAGGTELEGWPQVASQAIIASAGAADVNLDSAPEIFVGASDGAVYAWREDGEAVATWPALTDGDVFASPVAAQTDATGGLEIAAASLGGYLYLWRANGTLVDEWPKRLNTPVYASPAIGDLHGGGRASIVVAGLDGRIFVFDLAEKLAPQPSAWPQFRGNARRTGTP